MSIRALFRAIQHLLSQTSKLAQRITKKIVTGFLRNLLLVGRQPRTSRAGFVLPTTVLLLLVATLTVGSITYRTYTRTAQTIGDRQQRVIYNAATPAIDRARAKLEFLFDPQKDPRFPGGIPGEGRLLGMLLNDGTNGVQALPGDDVYTIPGETRVDINGDGTLDNAWTYEVDTDEDTVNDATVAYSILFRTPVVSEDPEEDELPRLTDPSAVAVEERADKLQVRQGPLSSVDQLNNACRRQNISTLPESGWIPDGVNTATLRKNFQIDAFVLPKNPTGTVTTLEFYQDRQVDRGNKWGAWFRNDLEIFPGPNFNWNGAMHTEGSLIVGKPQNGTYTSYMISSPASCLYVAKSSSEVSVANTVGDDGQEIPPFTGQIISGLTGKNDYSGSSRFHIFTGAGQRPNTAANDTTLEPRKDSVGNNSGGNGAADFALDPVSLLTKGISVARNANSVAPQDPAWPDTLLNDEGKGRILNKTERAPYVDDSFRADNRYGPKPRYENKKLPNVNIGDPITGDLMRDGAALPDDRLINDAPANADDDTSVGLDGYWERRARSGGMRLVVGQRLELGNPYPDTLGGYSTSPSNNRLPRREPLRPWAACEPASVNTSGRCNEARQRRTLIDNLAAVQATAVYHAASGNPDFPLACLATTAHPGTSVTLDRSTTFEDLAVDAQANGSLDAFPLIISDFFSGRGTNGWEYEPPRETSFPDAELTKALRNLAYFAGDPNGGAPSFNPLQDSTVHPYPSMAMWGDFSVLRRILDSSTPYANLSPADKTTLHTAACALGMLAYNLNYLSEYDYTNPNPNLNTLAVKLRAITDGNAANSGGVDLSNTLPPEAYINGLRQWRANDANEGVLDTLIPLAQLIMEKEQVERDRAKGFSIGESRNCTLDFSDVPGVGNTFRSQLAKLCSSQPRYPILYSLFPGDTDGINGITPDDRHGEVNYQSRDLDDISDIYISSENGTVSYEVVNLSAIQLAPRPLREWVTPHEAYAGTNLTTTAAPTAPYTTANHNRDVLIKECVGTRAVCYRKNAGNLVSVSFKDSGMYNGREMMNVRVLDVNLDLLRRTAYPGTDDFWLPESGIIYAFREDAVSESSIVRPSSGGGACDLNASFEPEGSACHMQGTGTEAANDSTDPPLGTYSISPKPVDYYPDPERRPYGFRLRRGASLWRGTSLSRPGDQGLGMSFITDNSVYIQGDFNLHRTLARARLEEFQDQLPQNAVYNENQFYGRTRIERNFANPTADQWRPTEILADAITLISDNFCDGSIEDGIITAGLEIPSGADLSDRLGRSTGNRLGERAGENGSVYGCRIGANATTSSANVQTSYLNQNRPNTDNPTTVTLLNGRQARWLRVDPYNPGSPILISRNGNPLKASVNVSTVNDEYGRNANEGYYLTSADKPLSDALDGTRVNSIIISGIVPSRTNQAYGGMHNFPRLLENWRDRKLYIAGSFLQLNFSNYATAPFDQDAFEVGSPPISDSASGELIKYYYPPLRLWGYDVGLQYAPAGPLAQRFVTFTSIRSEFYNEPPANDPYISNLCNAIEPTRCPA